VPFENLGLARKYPLKVGGPDASLADFAEFFKPDGTFWRFYNTELKNYLGEDGKPIPIAANMVTRELGDAVLKARDIRDALFPGGSGQLTFQYRVRCVPPVSVHGPAPNFSWTELSTGGQPPIRWNTGPCPWSGGVAWPGPSPSLGASIRANGTGTVLSETGGGDWGLFHLLDNPRTQFTASNNTVQVSFRLVSGQTEWSVPFEFQAMDGGPRHPFSKGFLRFKLPKTLCP
jgi:type VI secretion system protein ImpL